MNSIIKNVFLMIMGVTVAWFLYLALFGTQGFNGNDLSNASMGQVTQSSSWKGALWYMAEAVEKPISRYYYEYCYLPNIHSNDYVDEALNGSKSSTLYTSFHSTATGNYAVSGGYDDLYEFTAGSGDCIHYSTGWR